MEVKQYKRKDLDNATGEKCKTCGLDFGWVYAFGAKPYKEKYCSMECGDKKEGEE
jgi:hypothetical protein